MEKKGIPDKGKMPGPEGSLEAHKAMSQGRALRVGENETGEVG